MYQRSSEYYSKVKESIQDHVQSPYLSDEIKKELIKSYSSLKLENSQIIYDDVNNLPNTVTSSINFKSIWHEFLVGGLLTIGLITFISYLCERDMRNCTFPDGRFGLFRRVGCGLMVLWGIGIFYYW